MAAYEEDRAARARAVSVARERVAQATRAYAKGGSCDAVNAANQELADATYQMANPHCPVDTRPRSR